MPNVYEAAYNDKSGDDHDKEACEFKMFVEDAEQPLFKSIHCTKLDSMLKLK